MGITRISQVIHRESSKYHSARMQIEKLLICRKSSRDLCPGLLLPAAVVSTRHWLQGMISVISTL